MLIFVLITSAMSSIVPGTTATFDTDNENSIQMARFRCPAPFGSFADLNDCRFFYACAYGLGKRMRCPYYFKFDKFRKFCLPGPMAVCSNEGGDDDDTTNDEVVTEVQTTTAAPPFECPRSDGKYVYPHDCSKYFFCQSYWPHVSSCITGELFDAVKRKCRSAHKVHCGDRIIPELTTGETTFTEKEEETTTTEVPSPTTPRPTGPPETTCDEDDVDCIVDETGEVSKWFDCPEDIGAYEHASSNRLFILCLNWQPHLKRCGQDLVFSKLLRTCVSPEDDIDVDEKDWKESQ